MLKELFDGMSEKDLLNFFTYLYTSGCADVYDDHGDPYVRVTELIGRYFLGYLIFGEGDEPCQTES